MLEFFQTALIHKTFVAKLIVKSVFISSAEPSHNVKPLRIALKSLKKKSYN